MPLANSKATPTSIVTCANFPSFSRSVGVNILEAVMYSEPLRIDIGENSPIFNTQTTIVKIRSIY